MAYKIISHGEPPAPEHRCRLPNAVERFIYNLFEAAEVECACGKRYILHKGNWVRTDPSRSERSKSDTWKRA